jgi:hypothetical protein
VFAGGWRFLVLRGGPVFNILVRLSAIKSNLAKFNQILNGQWRLDDGAWPRQIVARVCRIAAL